MTAAASRFIIHHRLATDSLSAYNWMASHFQESDFIGIASSQEAGFTFTPTFPLYRQHAIREITRSIDRGVAAILWQDRFVAVTGYDSKQQILLIADVEGAPPLPLPYQAFGGTCSPYWYFQVFEARIELDLLEVYRESLMQALFHWETHDPLLPPAEYKCGSAAYGAMLTALHTRNYDQDGLPHILRAYATSKQDMHHYLSSLVYIWPSLADAAANYGRAGRAWQAASDLCRSLQPDHTQLMVQLATAQEAEEQAMAGIRAFMQETVELRGANIAYR